jgi:hypothetical protein
MKSPSFPFGDFSRAVEPDDGCRNSGCFFLKGPGGLLLDAARSIILIRTRDRVSTTCSAVAYDSALGPQISKLSPYPARVSIVVLFTIAPQEKKKRSIPLSWLTVQMRFHCRDNKQMKKKKKKKKKKRRPDDQPREITKREC